VALKVLHPSMVADPTRRKAFFKEARMMLQLDHDNVVEFHRILEEDGCIAFVMEYIEGQTLESWLQTYGGRIDQATIAALFADILRGVRHAHENGVIHRDLKPSNVMITRGGDGLGGDRDERVSAKVIDFGIARGTGEKPSRIDRERIRGTAAYMSPEEVESPEDVCEASDLYSIGVMLYEAAAGIRPFEAEDPREVMRAHVARSPDSPRQHHPQLAPELEFVILKTLAKAPSRRFKNAREMISALELCIRGMQAGGSGAQSGADIEQVVQTTEWSRPDHLDGNTDPEDLERWHRQLLSWLGMVVTILTATGQTGEDGDPHFLSRDDDMSARGGY
jgi:serine/threonine protein kinase